MSWLRLPTSDGSPPTQIAQWHAGQDPGGQQAAMVCCVTRATRRMKCCGVVPTAVLIIKHGFRVVFTTAVSNYPIDIGFPIQIPMKSPWSTPLQISYCSTFHLSDSPIPCCLARVSLVANKPSNPNLRRNFTGRRRHRRRINSSEQQRVSASGMPSDSMGSDSTAKMMEFCSNSRHLLFGALERAGFWAVFGRIYEHDGLTMG